MSETQVPLIHTIMPLLRKDVPAILKSRTNNIQKFKFRGIDDFINTLSEPLNKHGVMIYPQLVTFERDIQTTKNGGTMIYTLVNVCFRFQATDGSYVEASAIGEGFDSGDKSAAKAHSAVFKTIMLQVFNICTEDTPDADEDSPEAEGPINGGLKFDEIGALVETARALFKGKMVAGITKAAEQAEVQINMAKENPEGQLVFALLAKQRVVPNLKAKTVRGFTQEIFDSIVKQLEAAAEAVA